MGYPAWTILNSEEYGVVLAGEGSEDINEAFANARIVSKEVVFEGGFVRRALTLTSSSAVIEEKSWNLRWNGGEAGRKCWVTKI